MADALRLDIGCGDSPLPGYTPIDAKFGMDAYPLAVEDETVDEIHASHILEHFSHRQVGAVLADWVRALKPGGTLQIAVPDFATIAQAYLDGVNLPIQGYVMGGHVDEYDHHGTIFDEAVLTEAMQSVGLIAIARWTSDRKDCAALPISLNLQGTKPPTEWPPVAGVLSCPRLGWNDFWGCALESLSACGIRLTKYTGAFWDQGITRAAQEALKGGAEWLLTLDYDTVFTAADIRALQVAALRHPEADAIAAIQSHRTQRTPLLTIGDADGNPMAQIPAEMFHGELVKCRTAHFGCTLIRVSKLMALPKPWFWGRPDSDGEWGEGRTDPDISFWRAWEAAGNSLYTACRVPVGHIEVTVRWPGRDMAAVYQHPSQFHAGGKPEDVWR